MNCPRCSAELAEVLTRKGVVVDICPNGHGVWLDGGEIFFFVDGTRRISEMLKKGLTGKVATSPPCPRCGQAEMDNGRLVDNGPILDMCPECGGIWFDRDELDRLNRALGSNLDPYRDILEDQARAGSRMRQAVRQRQPAATVPQQSQQKTPGGRKSGRKPIGAQLHEMMPSSTPVAAATAIAARGSLSALPNLTMSSMTVLALLYAMVFAIFVIATTLLGANIHLAFVLAIAVILLQYLLSPFIMDLTLRLLQSLTWVTPDRLPAHLRRFIEITCNGNDMPFPRMGIIRDGTPNAFTYGHTPGNARVVITQGLLDILNEDEVEAVVAHELGHAKHWDILFMTLAGMVPVIFYYIYRVIMTGTRGRGGGGKGKGQIMLVGIASYVLYVVSQYVVLYLSRVREYYADRFGGEATGSPNTLATALVKVAYGLAGREPDRTGNKGGKPGERNPAINSMRAFGVFDPTAAQGLMTSSLRGSTLDLDNAVDAMQWDLWNPWALYYELNSTHPLPAKRIQALGRQAEAYRQEPVLKLNLERPESYWDEFFVDLLVMFAPLLGAVAGALFGYAAGPSAIPGPALLGLGAGYLINVMIAYRAQEFLPVTVGALLRKIKVSNYRPVPVTLTGEIIGRGIPGLIYSEDVVLRDNTGYMFVDYRQPLRVIELFYGLFRTDRFIGRKATITGWYRRAPVPYIEVLNIQTGGQTHNCYVYTLKKILAFVMIAAGLLLSVFMAGAF